MRKALCVLAVLAVVSPALAAPVVNGDFSAGESGWTRWSAPWGTGTWAITNAGPTPPEGTLTTKYGSFGWYQRVPVQVSEIYTLVGTWKGDVSNQGWAEVGYIMCTEGMTDSQIVSVIDAGAASITAAKKDGWGMNPPATWNWESIQLSPRPGGAPFEFHATCQEVTIFIKLGTINNSQTMNLSVDNIELVPEPATALLLGLPILFLRRRR